MARTNSDDLLDDDLAAAFLDDEVSAAPAVAKEVEQELVAPESGDQPTEDEWANDTDDFPGQLAVDVYETADKLVV